MTQNGSFRDRGYGYQCWSSGVIVTTADPLHDMWDKDPWKYEGASTDWLGVVLRSVYLDPTDKALFRNNVVLFKHFYVGNELKSTKSFLNDS